MKIKDIIFNIEDLSFQEALEYIVEKSLPAGRQDKKSGKKTFVVTINPEIVMLAVNDPEYEKILKSADLALADGIGIIWAGKMFGKSFKGRAHGVDLVNALAKEVSEKPITVGFLGGYGNVAQRTADCLKKKYPELKVSFALKEWPSLQSVSSKESRIKNQELSSEIHNSELIIHNSRLKCDILFVAFGSPKQEKWIYDHMKEIDAKVFIGVGGAFDFISGKVMRAPVFVRRMGLEWLFRLIIQPWRIKRQFALVRFVFKVIQEKLF